LSNTPKYSSFNTAKTSYVPDGAKLKKEFGEIRANLTKCLVNFRQSGMGSDACADKIAESPEGTAFGVEFNSFTQGDELLDYAYELFTKHDLLDAATCEMPPGSSFNSSTSRRRASLPHSVEKGSYQRGKGKAPVPRPTSTKKRGRHDLDSLRKVLHSMPPVRMHRTAADRAAQRAQSMRQSLKTHGGLQKLIDSYDVRLNASLAQRKNAYLALDAIDITDATDAVAQRAATEADLKVKGP
jgi:hypothetical protein